MPETSPPPAARRFAPTPVETTVKKSRRFAVDPVETSSRSNRKNDAGKEQQQQEEEEEEEQQHHDQHMNVMAEVEKKDFAPAPAATTAAPKRRFIPEPVETTFKSSKLQPANPLPTPELTPTSIPREYTPDETPKPRRRFVPELIETSKRTKKAGDARPATLPTDKTDLTPGIPNIYTRTKQKVKLPTTPIPPANTPEGDPANIPSVQSPPPLPRRQGSMKPHNNTRRSTRRNSFQPELEAILSSESDENSDDEGSQAASTPSLSGSFGSSEDSNMRLQLARTRESCDDRFSGYLLALAAKAAEKQLREQALAAFPNESVYQIVEHFYDREVDGASDAGSVEGIGLLIDDPKLTPEMRRKSTEVGWAAKEMQQHQEKLNQLRQDETNKMIAAEATAPTFKDPFWTNGMTAKVQENQDPEKEAELNRMRSAASPPMLGGDLKFRMCPSPKATKFESDQKPDVQPNRCQDGGGLWGGYCVAEEAGEYLTPSARGPPLIQTPQNEREDPFSSAFASEIPNGMRSPKPKGEEGGVRMLAGIDERLKAEVAKARMEDLSLAEFDDTFVTQVYNYLSLGYPVLARPYDEELARISRISENELREDDDKMDARGHIGIVDASGPAGSPGRGQGQPRCARWKALRLYILEWGRQHPSMDDASAMPSAWGVRARRGSWAI